MTGIARSLLRPAKPQISRDTAFALGFAAVAGHGVAVPGQAPIAGALGRPDEIARARKMRERPCAVTGDVADEAEFAARPQGARHRGNARILHEAPLPVPPLRPGIGMDQVDLMRTQPVSLAAAEERAVRMGCSAIIR